MEKEVKDAIVEAAKDFIAQRGIKQDYFAKLSGVGPSYLSNILSGKYTYQAASDKTVVLDDKYFRMIALAADYAIEVNHWERRMTPQYVMTLAKLEDAAANHKAYKVIGETGCGKTYAITDFAKAHPKDAIVVTTSNLHNKHDLINELIYRLDTNFRWRSSVRINKIREKAQEMYLQGLKPIIILDEAENMKKTALGACKAIYDATKDYCGFVLVGTPQLTKHLQQMLARDDDGIPQFVRRFKAGTVELPPIERKYNAFLSGIKDRGLVQLLCGMADNYGELHDYLEPAIREAAEAGVPLTEDFFRVMYNMPKTNKTNTIR